MLLFSLLLTCYWFGVVEAYRRRYQPFDALSPSLGGRFNPHGLPFYLEYCRGTGGTSKRKLYVKAEHDWLRKYMESECVFGSKYAPYACFGETEPESTCFEPVGPGDRYTKHLATKDLGKDWNKDWFIKLNHPGKSPSFHYTKPGKNNQPCCDRNNLLTIARNYVKKHKFARETGTACEALYDANKSKLGNLNRYRQFRLWCIFLKTAAKGKRIHAWEMQDLSSDNACPWALMEMGDKVGWRATDAGIVGTFAHVFYVPVLTSEQKATKKKRDEKFRTRIIKQCEAGYG